MPKQTKHAVVGVGVVGEWHVRVLSDLPRTDLVAVCDHNPANARANLEKNGLDVPVFATLEEMFAEHPEIEVCHIATPSGDHKDPAIMCMAAGKNVICEKPMEITAERIDEMIAAAKKHGVKIAGIFQNRWRGENRALRKALDEGRFGKLAYAGCFTPWYRTDEYYRDGGWRGTWKLDGGGAIMNQSVHYVDMLQWLGGPIKTVMATASSRIHPEIEVEDTLCASCLFESGAHGIIMGSTAMFPGAAQRMEVGGVNGIVMTGELKIARFRGEDGKVVEDPSFFEEEDKTSGGGSSPTDVPQYLHQRNFEAILDSWERGEEAETCGPEARKAVAIINALYASAKQDGQPVAVENK